MMTRLTAAQAVDVIRGYTNLSPLTDIKIHTTNPSGEWVAGKFKGIGPTHIDVGDNTQTIRVSLDDQFTHVYIDISADDVTLYLPTGAV